MKIETILAAALGVMAFAASTGRAIASEVLYDSSGFVYGQQSFDQSFDVTGPGTLTVTLSNIAWPESLASLNLVVSTPQGLLGPEMGAGTDTFQITGPSTVFAQWFGTAQGPLDAGVYGVNVSFSPTVVPLPDSIILLLSGLALLAWHRCGRGPLPG